MNSREGEIIPYGKEKTKKTITDVVILNIYVRTYDKRNEPFF